jgi:fatty acid omega-hydroxylase
MPLLHRLQQQGAVVDLQEVLLRFTFDNICAAAFGVEAGCLADGLPDVPFARAFERATELSLSRFVTPPFIWKAKRLLRVGGERLLTEAARSVREFADRTVSERRTELRKIGSLHGRSDLLSRLMSSSSSGATDHSDEFLRDFCISFILAGRDTSSVALVWFFWLLAGHPDVEARVLEDVRAARGDVKKMEYLHAALTEAMRLYPPVPIDFKEALEDDVLPDGTAIRARQRVIYNAYAIGRDPAVWGYGCQEFRPERWMKGGVFAGGAESPFKYVVFNAGPRLCVGKRFAYTQMKTLVAAVLEAFAVEVAPGQTVKPKLNTTLYMKNGLMVSFRIREASSTTATVAGKSNLSAQTNCY